MAAMATCSDVVHLEDNICVSCKDVEEQGSLKYYMLSAFLAMVEIFHALHSLWVTLFPFALLWWNVMLYATCAKYYSWNRSRLRVQQTVGRRFYGHIVQESSETTTTAEERGKIAFSPHQRGSSAAASHAKNRGVSILSLHRSRACAEAEYGEKRDVVSISHSLRKSHSGVAVDRFSGLCILDRFRAACLEESCPHHLNHFQEQIPSDTTSIASKTQAISVSSHTSKLSSLCFLEGGPQEPGLLKGCHCAACSFLLPHQVPPLAVLDARHSAQIPLEYSYLQVNLHRIGDLLQLEVPLRIDHVYVNCSMLREWLQTCNGGRVSLLHCGKKYPDLEWNFTKPLTSQSRNGHYAILQFILLSSEGSNIFNTIPSYDAVESVKLWIGEQWLSWDLSGVKMKSTIAYAHNEGRDLDSSEDVGSVCRTSIISDDECDGTYCTGTESAIDRDDSLEDSGVVYGKRRYRDDGYRYYECCRGDDDSGIGSVEDAKEVHEGFVHPAMDTGDGFYDCFANCDVGYDGPHCGMYVDEICSMDDDAADNGYNNSDSNVEDSGAVSGDFHFAHEDKLYGNLLERRQIHVAKVSTWWDEDAVLIDKQESEEDTIEQEWQVV